MQFITSRFLCRSVFLIIAGLFVSCQALYHPITHSTPHFTNGSQMEAKLSAGSAGLNLNLAYTPVKHVYVQLNGAGFPGLPVNSAHFTNSIEGGVGAYIPFKRLVIGMAGGYGLDATTWQLRTLGGYSGYTMNEAQYDAYKYFGQAYISFGRSESQWFYGCSLKLSEYHVTYAYARAEAGIFKSTPSIVSAKEFTFFMKKRISRRFFFTLDAGVSRAGATIFRRGQVISRAGLSFRLP